MIDKQYKEKANIAELNNLHGLVANQLAVNIDDPKILAHAIKFLKDNDITADIIESESMMSLSESIKKIANEESTKKSITVEDMLLKAK
jgi:hypothetical protein